MIENSVDFKAVFEALPGNFLILAPNPPHFTIVAISDELLHSTAKARENVVSKSVFELYPQHPEAGTATTGPSTLGLCLQEALQTKKPQQMPVVGYLVPGAGSGLEARYLWAHSKPVLDQQGEVLYIIHSLEDITERKRAEEALRESQAQIAADLAGMRRLYELQSKLAYQNDVKAAFQEVLALACQFTGTDRGCVQFLSRDGERLEMFVWQGYADESPFISFFRYEGLETGCEVARVHRQRLIIEDTVGFPGLEGTDAGAASYADGIRAAQSTPMASRSGETIGVISTQFRQPHRPGDHELRLMDMLAWTAAEYLERHRADMALRKAHERLQLAMNTGRIFSFEMDPATRQLKLSDNTQSVMGFPLPDHIDSTFELIHPDDLQPTVDLINGAIESGGSYASEYRLVNPASGQVIWFHSQAAFTDDAAGQPRFVGIAQNITERKLAEEALRESEALLQKAFSIDTVGQLYFTLDGGMRAANQAFERMSGYSRQQLLSLHWEVLTAPEFRDITVQAAGELADRGETAPYEKQFVRPDGSRWWGLCAPTRLKGQGPAAQCMEFIVDISERKGAEQQLRAIAASLEALVAERTQALQASQELLQLVFDSSPMAISVQEAVRDANGDIQDFRVLMLNKELSRELGRTDMVGKHYVQEYPGMKASGLFGLMRTTVETGQPQHMEYYYPYEGFNRWFSCMFVKLNDGVVATNLDITPRKQAEQQLLKNYQVLQQAEQVARIGSWEYDIATGSFTWSEGMYHLFGLPPGSPVNPQLYLDYALSADLAIAEKIVRSIQQQWCPFEETLRIIVNSQQVSLKIKAIVQPDPQGGAGKMLGVDVDLSEVKRLEQANLSMRLQQQQQLLNAILETQEEERRRISESLHNGVGQILYATKLSLAGVELDAPPGRKPQVTQSLGKASQLLTEAIVETRRVSHELVPILLKDYGLQKAVEEFCSRFGRTGIKLNCHCFSERLPAPLEIALYRIAQELVNNIVKHSGATRAVLEVSKDGDFVYLDAQDNGKGIDRDTLAGDRVGKGIGLRTIQDRVDLLGGRLAMESAPGKGTLITITLPLESNP